MATYSNTPTVEYLEYLVLEGTQAGNDVTDEYDFSIEVGSNQIVEVVHWAMVANDASADTTVQIEGWSQGKNDNFDNTNADGGNRFGSVYLLNSSSSSTYLTSKYPNDGGAQFPNPVIQDSTKYVDHSGHSANSDIAKTGHIVEADNPYRFYPGMEIYLRYRMKDIDDTGDNFRFNIILKRTTFPS